MRFRLLFALLVLASCTEEPGINNTDTVEGNAFSLPTPSKILWPFQSSKEAGEWYVTRGVGVATHKQSDYYALDYSVSNEEECLGKPFYAPFDGKVLFSSQDKQDNEAYEDYGNQVIIQANTDSTFALRVAHFSITRVFAEDEVQKGEILGLVGSTGNSTGCHAHIALYRNIYTGVMYDYDSSEITAIDRLSEGEPINNSLNGFPSQIFATPFEFVTQNDSLVFNRDSLNL